MFNFIRKKKIFPKFCSFIKKNINILSRILAYLAVDNIMKLYFLVLFFFISKKIKSLLQPTNLYLHLLFFSSFSLSWLLPFVFSWFFWVIMSMCMVRKSSTTKEKTYFSYYFFFLSLHLLLVLLLSVLLVFLFFIIYFYIIDITYKYNKLLLIWQKCLISYLIIFVYAFNGYCLTNL